ncbi:hypothetical protein E2C01_026606 [Portunus trituberculatus]|uniref:Uncharacterized protein n=1 Tax=Portunus trituberculatus TaxID=210409 RepID=A0A5B7EGJ5_PORTR|nr:hypothetical protein [Portunus trituberculatus]
MPLLSVASEGYVEVRMRDSEVPVARCVGNQCEARPEAGRKGVYCEIIKAKRTKKCTVNINHITPHHYRPIILCSSADFRRPALAANSNNFYFIHTQIVFCLPFLVFRGVWKTLGGGGGTHSQQTEGAVRGRLGGAPPIIAQYHHHNHNYHHIIPYNLHTTTTTTITTITTTTTITTKTTTISHHNTDF